MYDLNEFNANFPAENHDLPAVATREFGDAISASKSDDKPKAGSIQSIIRGAFQAFASTIRPAAWSYVGKTKYSR
jgi:hypothetical protein